jgi:hypothetical protein
MRALVCAAAALALLCASSCQGTVMKPLHTLLDGPGAEVDPGFAYYSGRSAESIASEIRANGYKHVHYVVTNDSEIRGDLIRAFHKEGLPVWYLTFCHVAYSTDDFPPGWDAWRMSLRASKGEDFTRLCMNNPDYTAFKRGRVTRSLERYPFDGVELVEPFWPDAPGPESPTYGCLCANCKAAFLKAYPEETDIPEFTDASSPRWYKSNPALYHKWVEFRTRSIGGFINRVLDGTGGIRKARPQIPTLIWTLAQESPNAVDTLREAQGNDAGQLAKDVHPSAICFQTNWMDWSKPNLPAEYLNTYEPFVQRLREMTPDTPFCFQVDTGSDVQSRESYAWLKTADATARKMGGLGTVNYEYFITKSMYDDPPRLVWTRPAPGSVTLVFQKRVDAGHAGDAGNYAITDPGGKAVGGVAVKLDGNMIHLTAKGLHKGIRYHIRVLETVDTPKLWLFPGYPQHKVEDIKASFVGR